MPLRKSNPKIDRRRTRCRRTKGPAIELSADSEPESSVASKDDEDEYRTQESDDGEEEEDKAEYQTPRKRRTPPRACTISNREQRRRGNDESSGDEIKESVDDESETKLEVRGTRRTANRSTGRRKSQRGDNDNGGGGVLASLPFPPSSNGRHGAVKARKKLTETTVKEIKDDQSDQDESDQDKDNSSDNGNDDDDESDYEDEDEDEEQDKEIDEMLQKRNKARLRQKNNKNGARKAKRKRAASSDEEFVLDSDDDGDDSSQELSSSGGSSNKPTEDNSDISFVGDPDYSDEDGSDDDAIGITKRKGKKYANTNPLIGDNRNDDNAVNVDEEQIGTIDDESDSDVPQSDKDSQRVTRSADKSEILPSPKGMSNVLFETDGEERTKSSTRIRRKVMCPKCPSTEDAITLEPLPKLHVCYIAPDGKSRVCFKLETLRQIALKSSKLELRVDIDAQRQNFLQPPAFRTPMSDDLVDQIASKFGRVALDLHGPYYKNREVKYDRKNYAGDDDHSAYSGESNSSGDENIYDSLEDFRERVKNYFRKGMGSQDLYVCPLCYGQIHRSLSKKQAATNDDDTDSGDDDDDDAVAAEREYDAAASDSVYDPITVLGHLDNDEMNMASQFCFKRLADVKRHLRQEHNVDTSGVQGNELYKRFLVRAPDGLLQRWLSTEVRGQVKQGHMRIYWGQGYDQIYIQLLDLIEQVKAYKESAFDQHDDSSEGNGGGGAMDEYVNKAERFFGTFATKAAKWWELISSPFLKSNESVDDFIAEDDHYSEEDDSGGHQPHAAIHHRQQLMNEESDENDFVHKLQRKYAEPNDEESANGENSSTEEELEFINEEEEEESYEDGKTTTNGYYSPIEEEKDEWMLKLQSARKRKASSAKKEASAKTKMKTPTGKKLFRRKTTPSVTGSSTRTRRSVSKKKRILSLEDSSSDDDSV